MRYFNVTKLLNLQSYRINQMKRNHFILGMFLVLTLMGCHRQQPSAVHDGWLQLPENKVWAHRVNDTLTAQAKEKLFGGLELDIIYSPSQNKLFVCHNEEDTLKGLTLQRYFASLKHPEKLSFWLDIKNLNTNTADTISVLIKEILNQYNLIDHAFLENPDSWALQKVKSHELHTSLWVDNFHWSGIDTASWVAKVNSQIATAHPDAISCEYRMFGALTEFFADQNIFLWHTPAPLTPENAELTKTFCRHPSVKIVLVDYDKPIEY